MNRTSISGWARRKSQLILSFTITQLENDVPLDFVSTHVYGNDSAKDVFHDDRQIAPHQMVCLAVKKVHEEIVHSTRPELPLIWSEFNASYMNEQPITDSIYMGPWMAQTISQCDGMVNMMSYWTFSDVFEEQGVIKTPFYGGYGLVAEDGIPKPAFDVFELLHSLGTERLPNAANNVLVTRRKDGAVLIAAWNLVEPGAAGADRIVSLDLKGIAADAHAVVRRVDASHGDTLDAWKRMGNPKYPTKEQIEVLRNDSRLGAPEIYAIRNQQLTLTLPPMGLAVVEIH
jgi:xylan 1,4-beta-xylosidase